MRKILATTSIGLLLIPSLLFATGPTDYVSCFNFDEASGATRIDANTTNSNDLTDVNTVTSTSTGIVGNSAVFVRTGSDHLTITDANQLNLDDNGDHAFGVWYKPLAAPAGSGFYHNLASKWVAGSGAYAWQYGNNGGTLQLVAQLFDSGDPAANVGFRINQTLTLGTKYRIWYSYDVDTNTETIYVNGSSIGGTTGEGTVDVINNSTGPFVVGRYQDTDVYGADGVIDTPTFLNREITSAEVTADYNSGNGEACPVEAAPRDPSAPHTIIGNDIFIGSDSNIGL